MAREKEKRSRLVQILIDIFYGLVGTIKAGYAFYKKYWLAFAIILPVILFTYLFSLSTHTSLNDPDLWWHLESGEYIVKHMELPEKDPFAFTSPTPLNDRQLQGLHAHWLGQVFTYLSYKAFGLAGLGLLRGVLIILPMVILYIWLLRKGAGLGIAFASTILVGAMNAINLYYAFERPQGFSFTFAMVAILILERLRRTREPFDISYVLLPVLTAIWSNVHAGFIVGNIIIVIYMVGEAMEATYRTYFMRQDGAFNIRFFIFATLALITSGLNPNAYHLFWEYFSGLFNLFTTDVIGTMTGKRGAGSDWVRGVVLEYKPLTYFYKNMGYRWLMFYWIFTVVLYIAMLTKYLLRKSIDLREFFTVSFVVLFANMYARGLMFSLPVMAAYFGKTLFELSPPRATFRRIAIILTSGMLIITLLFGAHTGLTSMQALTPGVTKDWITPWYPTKAVDFLLKNRIAPPMYNYYTWGGFLIWGTYPHYKVFIDGRAIDNNANKTADGILKCYPGWQNKLDVYGINFIIIPLVFRESGYVIPMGRNLAFENKWKLVFIQNNSAIFVRDIPQNREIIQKYGIDKKRIFYEIIAVENLFLSMSPNNPVFNMAKADALLSLGSFEEARKIYERFPSIAGPRLRQLRQMGH